MSGKGEDDMSVRGPLLSIRGLTAAFRQEAGLKEVVRDVHADLFPEETLALVGESGSGKTVTAASVLRLIPSVNIEYPSGEVLFRLRNAETVNTLSASERELMRVRGEEIGMIFQEPMSSLNPLHTVEK